MTEPAITFTIARNLIAQAAEQGRTIKVTVQGPHRILARLGDAPAPPPDPAAKAREDWNRHVDTWDKEQPK